MSIVYLRIDGDLVNDQVGEEHLPQARQWDQVPAVGDIVQELALGDFVPQGEEPRYVVAQRTWMIQDNRSQYANQPQGVILDLKSVSAQVDTPEHQSYRDSAGVLHHWRRATQDWYHPRGELECADPSCPGDQHAWNS